MVGSMHSRFSSLQASTRLDLRHSTIKLCFINGVHELQLYIYHYRWIYVFGYLLLMLLKSSENSANSKNYNHLVAFGGIASELIDY